MRHTGAVRGERIDIGGRALRVVRAGPPGGLLAVLEHGAFGCATDWSEVQARLAAAGWRSLAYDRAGLGYSDPGPAPRDGLAMHRDRAALLAALGEAGPFVAVGHSMGGLAARLFALSAPDQVRGLVLADAVTPEITARPLGLRVVRGYGRMMDGVAVGARLGLMRPVSRVLGGLIGLTGEAAAEKRRIYGDAAHARGAAAEIAAWPDAAEQAARPLPPDLPVAVVTAGAEKGRERWKAMQAAPALASRRGHVEHVAGARHASLLGPRYADAVVRGVATVGAP